MAAQHLELQLVRSSMRIVCHTLHVHEEMIVAMHVLICEFLKGMILGPVALSTVPRNDGHSISESSAARGFFAIVNAENLRPTLLAAWDTLFFTIWSSCTSNSQTDGQDSRLFVHGRVTFNTHLADLQDSASL
jgi:hypothetical protein